MLYKTVFGSLYIYKALKKQRVAIMINKVSNPKFTAIKPPTSAPVAAEK